MVIVEAIIIKIMQAMQLYFFCYAKYQLCHPYGNIMAGLWLSNHLIKNCYQLHKGYMNIIMNDDVPQRDNGDRTCI